MPTDLNNLESMFLSNKYRSQFLEKRMIFLWGTVEDNSAKEITQQLLFLESQAPGEEIRFYINSPGGVVTAGMVVYDTMQMISSPVSTICLGLAASMGSLLLSGGEKGKRMIFPSGRVMIHQPSVGQIFGQASDIQIQAKEMARTKDMGAKVLAKNCGKSVEDILRDFDRDFWMNAEESVKYGIVDSVTTKIPF